MTNFTTTEYIALSEYLSEWDETKSYAEILESLNDRHVGFPDEVTPCEFFEDWYALALAERIDNLKKTLERNFLTNTTKGVYKIKNTILNYSLDMEQELDARGFKTDQQSIKEAKDAWLAHLQHENDIIFSDVISQFVEYK